MRANGRTTSQVGGSPHHVPATLSLLDTDGDGLVDGKGIFTYKNGDVYNGPWLDGMKHGKVGCFSSPLVFCAHVDTWDGIG